MQYRMQEVEQCMEQLSGVHLPIDAVCRPSISYEITGCTTR